MDVITDTTLAHATLFWPLRPPRATMIVAVKATVALPASGTAELAEVQDPLSGPLPWDDDPEASLRTPNELALVKPRGECFVAGSCRPLTGRAEERTIASVQIGSVRRTMTVHGDRVWTNTGPSRPVPFTEMPLSWERAFGGPGYEANPLGRGLGADDEGTVWLPNVELEGQGVQRQADRPTPGAPGPIGLTWKARHAHVGTYDERWRRERWPWLPEDFRFAYFNEAPADLRADGHWRGDEEVALQHLHPEHPRVATRLPGLRPRVFIERDETSTSPGSFEELGLVLDTITVDADRGLALCVWRGAVDLEHDRLQPDGIARLFVMHEALDDRTAIAACRARMLRRIDEQAEAHADLEAAPVPTDDADAIDATQPELAPGQLAAVQRRAEHRQQRRAKRAEADAALAKLEADLIAAGVDPAKLKQDADPIAAEPPDLETLRRVYDELEVEMPDEFERLLTSLDAPDASPPEEPPPPTDLRTRVIEAHRAGRPIRGDFAGVMLDGLDLRGLDARDAVLVGASCRGANLQGARLDGASLIRADFLSANLEGASMRGADLAEAVLEDANLSQARLHGAFLGRAELQAANLERAELAGADLTDARLDEANLTDASCEGALMSGANLSGCRMVRTRLVDARLYAVTATEATLDGAVLTGARVGRGANFTGSQIRGVEATGSHWREAVLVEVDFSRTCLDGGDFSGADLTRAQLGGCPLRGALFVSANLTSASLRGADGFEGSFQGANLTATDLRGANLYRANFFRAHGEGATVDGANLTGTYWGQK